MYIILLNIFRCNSCLHNSFFYYFYFFYYYCYFFYYFYFYYYFFFYYFYFYYYFFFYYSFYNRYLNMYLCLLNNITNTMIFWYMLCHIFGSFSLTPSLSNDLPGTLERGCLHTSPMDAPYLLPFPCSSVFIFFGVSPF